LKMQKFFNQIVIEPIYQENAKALALTLLSLSVLCVF